MRFVCAFFVLPKPKTGVSSRLRERFYVVDREKPAAAVSRALEKLDDEEEPPAYDFTPDKAKPAKHRSSVEVDELWPAAGAGAGDQRVQGAGKRHGLRLGLGPGQPHLSARAHVVRVEPPPHR